MSCSEKPPVCWSFKSGIKHAYDISQCAISKALFEPPLELVNVTSVFQTPGHSRKKLTAQFTTLAPKTDSRRRSLSTGVGRAREYHWYLKAEGRRAQSPAFGKAAKTKKVGHPPTHNLEQELAPALGWTSPRRDWPRRTKLHIQYITVKREMFILQRRLSQML